jgi:hypothetical protein
MRNETMMIVGDEQQQQQQMNNEAVQSLLEPNLTAAVKVLKSVTTRLVMLEERVERNERHGCARNLFHLQRTEQCKRRRSVDISVERRKTFSL